jgi:hypothetical protein
MAGGCNAAGKLILLHQSGFKPLQEVIKSGIRLRCGSQSPIVGYCGSDFAKTENQLCNMFSSLAAAQSIGGQKKQAMVALSTCEAEYGAVKAVAKEFLWLCQLMDDLECLHYAPKELNSDNQGAIALAKATLAPSMLICSCISFINMRYSRR